METSTGQATEVVEVAAVERWAQGYLRQLARLPGAGKQSKVHRAAERALQEALAFARTQARPEPGAMVPRGEAA